MPTRVDDLWFAQGMIIIRAENKIFRVSGAVLAARSTVFGDMIAFPQPAGDTEQIDGSPVVRLHDPACDVEVFLRAIYDSSYFMPAPAPIELWIVLAILRLSHKYDVRYLHHRALHHLSEDGWYRVAHDQNLREHLIASDSDLADNLAILATATQVGALWLLPWAYYCASTFLPEELDPLLEGKMKQYIRKCLAAHARLVRGTIRINGFLTMRSTCATRAICDDIREDNLHVFFDIDAQHKGSDLNPLGYWAGDISEQFAAVGVCGMCCQLAKARHREASSAFWDKLPSLFGLPPWEDLHAMKEGAIGE
ncbi:hypothetical protein C8R44DRAFT_631545 [Mycena epipterygia]|nr:hypothetical protein C8R44DRAFT_631545 [Mycena epipterygia]